MDGSSAIEENRVALKRIAAMLVDMAGLGNAGPEEQPAGGRKSLPRLLWRAILSLLRPAESAARRLVIAAARTLAVPSLRPRPPKPKTMEPLLRKFGIAVMFAPGAPSARTKREKAIDGATCPRIPALPLFDPPRRLALFDGRSRTVPPHAAPRIVVPGITELAPLPSPPSPDDLVSAESLTRRIAALAAALDDLPGHTRRFVRLKARLEARRAHGPHTPHRLSPLRGGRPPGGRLHRYDPTATHPRNIREVDEILAHAHSLALYALERPDTS
ncbi:MAG: hypothetical protein ACXIVF_11370 [Rhizobiaceae bacterium]